MQHINPFMGLG